MHLYKDGILDDLLLETIDEDGIKLYQAELLDTVRTAKYEAQCDVVLAATVIRRDGGMRTGGHPCQRLPTINNPEGFW